MPMSMPTPMPTLMPMPMLSEIFTFIIVLMFKSKWSSKAYINNVVITESQFNWS